VLSDEGVGRASEVIAALRRRAMPMADRVHCFATASLRGVVNARQAAERIRRETGVEIRLLSGEEEAYYDYIGLIHNLTDLRDAVALDIGGGSMEIMRISDGQLTHCVSLPTGSLKLSLEFSGGRIPLAAERGHMDAGVRALLDGVDWLPGAGCDTLCTIGGTARAAAKLHKAVFARPVSDPYVYRISDLDTLLLYLADDSHFSRLEQLIPGRVTTIVPGVIALHAVARAAGSSVAILSKYGVREGYLLGALAEGGGL
jgi:exopolyphosphatase/guanosine-5'-triphosphate,3'-diphosphate pyrophosphatase